MTAITIDRLDDEDQRLLRLRAAEHGRSVEAEARAILRDALHRGPAETNWLLHVAELGRDVGGVDLEIAPREQAQDLEL
ncbi:FitA-like ribbon-helix-helix domain-containing protein [uncultured Tessaracoccus sp.]|uniref:FitA-like ribbon-helix-helix domain-containing protein n=1 Tax=uncultured Tessaracoccus sp. TaxID=905023 RepID=UPI0025F94A5A|nr:plasmid stabilization protein [uncultured Tessaracoccus sp.]